ncbi:MAG TPA: hypothetical protein VGL01_04750 [Trinickia sp.]|uniref:hypothetical protein n=1 Tax=Trinickia sp. TaxID=2571163 RepID=UPI002F413EE6
MTYGAVQTVSGAVISVSQKPIVIDVWSPNIGPTTDQVEQITFRLDSIDLPLILRTGKTRELFVANGDRLHVACIAFPDRLAILGIRNVNDGSVYMVRTANVVSTRREIYTAIFAVVVWGMASAVIGFVQRSTHLAVDSFLIGAAVSVGFGAVSTIVRSLFGWSVWPDIRKLVQPGGKHEMHAAGQALGLGPKEERTIRFL